MGDSGQDYYRAYERDTRSLDYSAYGVSQNYGSIHWKRHSQQCIPLCVFNTG